MPLEFNQKFNQNLTKESQAPNKFSCFPTIEEEGDNTFLDDEVTLSESDPEEFEFELKAPSEVDAKNAEDKTAFASIHSISKERGTIFSAWRPYVPPEPVFGSSSAQSWWSASSLMASLSPEPTLTRISLINCSNSTTGQTPIPVSTTHNKIKMK